MRNDPPGRPEFDAPSRRKVSVARLRAGCKFGQENTLKDLVGCEGHLSVIMACHVYRNHSVHRFKFKRYIIKLLSCLNAVDSAVDRAVDPARRLTQAKPGLKEAAAELEFRRSLAT